MIIAVVIDLSEKVDDFLEHEANFYDIVLRYYANFVPFIVFFLSPIFIFISVIFFTSKLASRSEIVAVLSGGISFYRILFVPYMIGAAILAGVQYGANHYLVPIANQNRIAFENEFVKKRSFNTEFNIRIQAQPGVYVSLNSFSNKDSIGRKLVIDYFKGDQLVGKLMADKAVWKGETQSWTIKNWQERSVNGMKERVNKGLSKDTVFGFIPEDLRVYSFMRETMTTPKLISFIQKEEAKGTSELDFFRIEHHRRTAVPFATFILTIIGFSMASRKTRGGTGWHLLMGIAISCLYILVMQFSTTFSTNAGLSPILSVWLPNIFFGFLGIYLMLTAPK